MHHIKTTQNRIPSYDKLKFAEDDLPNYSNN